MIRSAIEASVGSTSTADQAGLDGRRRAWRSVGDGDQDADPLGQARGRPPSPSAPRAGAATAAAPGRGAASQARARRLGVALVRTVRHGGPHTHRRRLDAGRESGVGIVRTEGTGRGVNRLAGWDRTRQPRPSGFREGVPADFGALGVLGTARPLSPALSHEGRGRKSGALPVPLLHGGEGGNREPFWSPLPWWEKG